jgi:hypothetical protein
MTRTLGPDPHARRAAPPGMRAQVMRAGARRRRFALAGAGSLAAVAVFAAAGVFAGSPGSSDSLRVDQPAGGHDASGRQPVGLSAPRDSGATAAMQPAGAPRAAGAPAAQPAPHAAPAPTPSGRASSAPNNGHGNHGPMTRTEREFGELCPGGYTGVGTGGVSSGEWCVFMAPPGSRDSTPYPTLTFTVCRSVTKDAGALTFDTAQEADFVISLRSTKKALWTWSTGQRFRSTRHVLYVGYSQCIDWQTNWDWRDDRGATIRAGQSLRLTCWSTSKELRNSRIAADFTS